jgi:quercetin dioxygenase-like cupin family protein
MVVRRQAPGKGSKTFSYGRSRHFDKRVTTSRSGVVNLAESGTFRAGFHFIEQAGAVLTKQDHGVGLLETVVAQGGEWLTARPGEHFCVRVPPTATGGAYSVVEFIADPGDSTPLHVHSKEDEYLLVLEGTARVVLGDKTIEATAGQTLEMKRGIPHAWGNPGDKPIRLLFTAAPGGCEQALVTIAKGGEIDLPALAAQYGVTPLGPPILG